MALDDNDRDGDGTADVEGETVPDAPAEADAAGTLEAADDAEPGAVLEAAEAGEDGVELEPEATAPVVPPPRAPAAPPKAPSRPAAPEPSEFEEPANDAHVDVERGPRRFSRRGLIIFLSVAGLLLIGVAVVAYIVLLERKEAEICAEARRTQDPQKLRECWNCKTQDQWKKTVLWRIAENDMVENLDIAVEAIKGGNAELAVEGANVITFMVQSRDPAIRAKIKDLTESLLIPQIEGLAKSEDQNRRKVRGLLALALVWLEDVRGLDVAMAEAANFGFEMFSAPMFGDLADRRPEFFDGLMKLSATEDASLQLRVINALQEVDYSGRDATTTARKEQVVALLRRVLGARPAPDVELASIMCWAETGEAGALERVAEYFDRAAVLEDAESVSERQQGMDLHIRADQIFQRIKLRFGAEKLVELYRLIKKNKLRREKILYLVRELHDPRPAVRDFLDEMLAEYTPPEDNFAAYLDEADMLTHRGRLYVNAVFALAELLDPRVIDHLKGILNKFSTMVRITDEQANLYNAGLLILGAIAVREGGQLEEDIARYIFELSNPEKYPERWMEKRAGKMRILSFIASDLWQRFLAEHPECQNDIDPVTTLARLDLPRDPETDRPICRTAVDLKHELPPTVTDDGTVIQAAPPSVYEELPEMQRRRERERQFTLRQRTLDEVKREELQWVFNTETLDTKQKIFYFIKTFSCAVELSMVQAMMDRNDPNVRAYERWCGDYAAATESLARLAHDASDSFQREARQFLAERLDKTFLTYPGTREPIRYDQYMNKDIYNFVMYRQAVAKSLGYLGTRDPKLLEALAGVVWDETDHPQVGRYAGVSLGIVADADTWDRIVTAFIDPETHPDTSAYLLQAINGHFRFAPLNAMRYDTDDADRRAIARLAEFLGSYQGGFRHLPATRMFLLGVLFGSAATTPETAGKLADLVLNSTNSRIREISLLGLICSAGPDQAGPVFERVFAGDDEAMAELRSQTTLKALRDVYVNVGTPNDPYTIMIRSSNDIRTGVLFRRLQTLAHVRRLGHREFIDYYVMRLALALGVDKDAMDAAYSEAGLEATDKYTPIAYKLSYRDNFTYYETPYLTWVDELYTFAMNTGNDMEYRKLAIELLWRIDERGFVYAIYDQTTTAGETDAERQQNRALHDYVYESVMREFR